MTFHIIYRTNGSDASGKLRPAHFSKLRCLTSLAASVAAADSSSLTFTTLADGECDQARLSYAASLGPVQQLPGLGNGRSLRYALRLASALDDNDEVLIIEDDYLVRPACVDALRHAMASLPEVDYFSPYDHPDRYRRKDDWGDSRLQIWHDGQRHWRSCESNTGTFASQVRRLRQDRFWHSFMALPPTPQGRSRWRTLTQVPLIHGRHGRAILAGPMPSLATHVEVDQVAPGMEREVEDAFGAVE